MKTFWRYVLKVWKPFVFAILFLLFETVCDLTQPKIMSNIIDMGVANRDLDYVLRMSGLMLGVTALGAISAITRNFISSNVSQRFGMELRSNLYSKIQSFSFETIDKFETASLMTRLTNDITQLNNFLHGLMRIFIKAPMLCIGSIVMAVTLNPSVSVVLAVIVPIITILIALNMKIGYPIFTKVQRALDRVNGIMREYLSGVRVVKAFNRFQHERERFKIPNEELSSISTKAMRVMAIFSPAVTIIMNIGIVIILWAGGIKVNNGTMKVGQLIAFVNYMTQILMSLMMISFVFQTFVRAKASAERVEEVLLQESGMPVPVKPETFTEQKGSVEFRDVVFSYSGTKGEPVLKNISFRCKTGETIGIIGSTGSGKTSLVNLIPRFYDTSSGTVYVNGIDVKKCDIKELRNKIAIVSQKAVLFTGKIVDNIKWGKEDASEQEIVEAARAAQAHNFINEFKEGYETVLGQGGVNLSGGQKQRISIARALVKKPEILILDDCTSAVDVVTEARIREALSSFSKDLTCLIIAQRITSVMYCDKVIVLDNGEMAGYGTHEQLMVNCSVYRDIYRSQIGNEGVMVNG